MLTDTHRGIGFIIYDANNLPVQAYLTNGQQLVYETDVYGNRVRNTISGTSDNFYFYGANGNTEVVCNLPYSSNLTYNILGNAGDNIGQVKVVSESSTRYYYLKDHLGSIKMTVDTTGTVVGYDDYYPYGLVMSGRSSTSSADGRYKFTGKERDASDGLDYFGARYYDCWNGRWNQVDPAQNKYPGLSPYNYVLGNPLKMFDPDGKWAWLVTYIPSTGTPRSTRYDPATERGMQFGENKQGKYLPFSERDRQIFQNRVNDKYLNKWSNTAPNIATYLRDNQIAFTVNTNLGKYGEHEQAGIILDLSTYNSSKEEGTVLHELVHDYIIHSGYLPNDKLGETEYYAYSVEYALGYMTDEEVQSVLGEVIKGMPEGVQELLKQGKWNDVLNAMKKEAKKITGNYKIK
jgi:RHS repeat-associated protein